MRIWLDTEFNSFQGELLSIGMIAENGEYFYAWFDIGQKNLHPWVLENVYPHINYDFAVCEPEHPHFAKQRLSNYLRRCCTEDWVEIIVDWPEDVKHLTEFMITGPGLMIETPVVMKFTIDRSINGQSRVPHNALRDAIGNMEFCLTREEEQKQNRNKISRLYMGGDDDQGF